MASSARGKTYSRRGLKGSRRQYVFAKRIILTSPILGSQCGLDINACPLIDRIGSALYSPASQDDALTYPIQDIMELV